MLHLHFIPWGSLNRGSQCWPSDVSFATLLSGVLSSLIALSSLYAPKCISDPSPELQHSTTTYLLDISCRIFHWIVTQHIPNQTPHSSIPTHTQNSLCISVNDNLSLQLPSPSTGKSVTLDLFSHRSRGKSYWSQLQNKSRIWRPHHFLYHSLIHRLSSGLLQLLQIGPSFSTCLCNMGCSWHRDWGHLFTWKFHHLSFLLTSWWSPSSPK